VPYSLPAVELCELLVCSHAFVAKSFPNRIVDLGVSKHVVQDRVGFVDFHPYPVGLQTVILGNGTAKDVLGVERIGLSCVEEIRCFFTILFMHLGCDVPWCLMCP